MRPYETELPIRQAIGGLMYLMNSTRLDICFAVKTLSQYTNKRNSELWSNLKRILRYVKGTMDLKLIYTRCEDSEPISAYADANFAKSEAETVNGEVRPKLKTSSGFIINLFDKSLIYWNTKRQTATPASTAEAEYVAVNSALREILWLKQLLIAVGISVDKPIVIHEDNQACIKMVNDFMATNRHIQIPCDRIKDRVQSNQIILHTNEQLADMFTKSLPKQSFVMFREKMGIGKLN